MRKISLLLTVLLMIGLQAAGQPAPVLETTYVAFEHPRLGYALQYPASWTLLDKDSLSGIIDAMASGELDLSDTTVQMMMDAKDQVETDDVMLVISPGDTGHNANMVVTDVGVTLSAEEAMQQVGPQLKQYLKEMFPGLVWEDQGSLVKMGAEDAVRMAYSVEAEGERFILNQYYLFAGGLHYTLTFTWVSPLEQELSQLEIHKQHMLETFQLLS